MSAWDEYDGGENEEEAALVLNLATAHTQEIDNYEQSWDAEGQKDSFVAEIGPLTWKVINHLSAKTAFAEQKIRAIKERYPSLEADLNGIDIEGPFVRPEVNDLTTGMDMLRVALRKQTKFRLPERAAQEFADENDWEQDAIYQDMADPMFLSIVDARFERVYNKRKVKEFCQRLLARCADGDEHFAREIARLANNNWGSYDDLGYGLICDFSAAAGRANIQKGAKKWLDRMTDAAFSLASAKINPANLFRELLHDVRQDMSAATYERLYVAVRSIFDNTCEVYVIAFIRAILQVLIWEPLTLEQAIFVVRGFQLLCHIEHDDRDKKRMKQELESAVPGVAEHCRNHVWLREEFLAAVNEYSEQMWVPFDNSLWYTQRPGPPPSHDIRRAHLNAKYRRNAERHEAERVERVERERFEISRLEA